MDDVTRHSIYQIRGRSSPLGEEDGPYTIETRQVETVDNDLLRMQGGLLQYV